MRIVLPLCVIACLFLSKNAHSTHNLAGEITYTHDGNLTVEFRVNTFTKLSSVPADRDSLFVCFGDGDCQWALRINGPDNNGNGIPDGEVVGPDHKMSIYANAHTYASNGQYTVSMSDPNRNGGIMNIFNSVNIPFHIETTFYLDSAVPDVSPVMLEFPIDKGVVGEPFIHIPNAFDADGDSLVFTQVIPLQDVNTEIPNYQFVEDILPGPNNQTFLDSESGFFDWSSPQMEGSYTIAIQIDSYRDGVLISSVIRDMQIDIYEEDNFPPDCIISTPGVDENNPVMVQVGDTVRLDIVAAELPGQVVDLTSTSGLFNFFDQNAEFTVVENGSTANGHFEWIVGAEHVRQQPYLVVFKAKNNDMSSQLSAFRKVRYLVVDQATSLKPVGSALPGITVFPNPVGLNGDVFLDWNGNFTASDYSIYNTEGRIVARGPLTTPGASISTIQLSPGLYYLLIRDSGFGKQVLTFIVARE